MTSASVSETRFRGEPAITMRAGGLEATFLPELGMTGVSLRFAGGEHLALPGGLDALRTGHTVGLPLLAPWANRLASRRYRVGRVEVDLTGRRLTTDERGLPIHGLLLGKPGWRIARRSERAGTARVQASIDVDSPAFPFPHRIEVVVTARATALEIVTRLIPNGRRSVPVAFGWHPILRLPSGPRRDWRLRLPARSHLELDRRGLPTGASVREAAEAAPIGRRRFDDLYALGRDRTLALDAEDGASIELRASASYPYAQVWVPPGRPFAALEPMAAPTDALGSGKAPLVRPGDSFSARYTLTLGGPSRTGARRGGVPAKGG